MSKSYTLHRLDGVTSQETIYVYDKNHCYVTGMILKVYNITKTQSINCVVKVVPKEFLIIHGVLKPKSDLLFFVSDELLNLFGKKKEMLAWLVTCEYPRQLTSYDANYKVACNLVRAQMASDEEKGYPDYRMLKTKHTFRVDKRYGAKIGYIKNAVEGIIGGHTDFDYSIIFKPDQKGHDSMVVFFETVIEDETVQVSFHVPYQQVLRSNAAYKLSQLVGTETKKIQWIKRTAGNKRSCEKLINFYKI